MTDQQLETVKILNETLHVMSAAMKDVKPLDESQYAFNCAVQALSKAVLLVAELTKIPCEHCSGTGRVSIYD